MFVMIPVLKMFTILVYAMYTRKQNVQKKSYVENRLCKHRRKLYTYFFKTFIIYDIKQMICLVYLSFFYICLIY